MKVHLHCLPLIRPAHLPHHPDQGGSRGRTFSFIRGKKGRQGIFCLFGQCIHRLGPLERVICGNVFVWITLFGFGGRCGELFVQFFLTAQGVIGRDDRVRITLLAVGIIPCGDGSASLV